MLTFKEHCVHHADITGFVELLYYVDAAVSVFTSHSCFVGLFCNFYIKWNFITFI